MHKLENLSKTISSLVQEAKSVFPPENLFYFLSRSMCYLNFCKNRKVVHSNYQNQMELIKKFSTKITFEKLAKRQKPKKI